MTIEPVLLLRRYLSIWSLSYWHPDLQLFRIIYRFFQRLPSYEIVVFFSVDKIFLWKKIESFLFWLLSVNLKFFRNNPFFAQDKRKTSLPLRVRVRSQKTDVLWCNFSRKLKNQAVFGLMWTFFVNFGALFSKLNLKRLTFSIGISRRFYFLSFLVKITVVFLPKIVKIELFLIFWTLLPTFIWLRAVTF